ncbi:hypothetical protein CRUP_016814 [Coryphaenoides rupestris]|nr:hypothetical protein CRUP_016814 [Coryphaenoides rupestris]
MKAVFSQTPSTPAALLFIFLFILYTSCYLAELQVCHTCNGTVPSDSVVGRFCSSSSAGRVEGRCCLHHLLLNSSQTERVIGDLSSNPIANISDLAFQGFAALNEILLPSTLSCPGGNASWESVSVTEGSLICQGQKSMCNETRHMSYHGYKCRREGEFPLIQVFAPLGGATVLLSVLLWVAQRRKVKST